MDRIDYTFKFSTELIVFVLSFIIIGINFAGASTLESFNNNNLFAKLLSYHSSYNKSLYAKQTAIKTVIENSDSQIIPAASAQIVLASDQIDPNNSDPNNSSQNLINGNIIEKPNPDTVRTMIVDQIKVYKTQPGDTLQGIADKFNISTNTIIWANNLPNQTIKPGWDLLILPVSGVLHKVTNNDTLPDIAKKFNADINQIISYNNLTDESDINPGDILIVPGGSVPTPPKPKPAIRFTVKGRTYFEPAPDEVQKFGGAEHIFPWGQCTWYVAKLRHVPWGGNAKMWLYNAASMGVKTGRTPIPGAIVVTSESRRYGHVALVEKVDGDRFLVTEMNYEGFGRVDERWITLGSSFIRGFIY